MRRPQFTLRALLVAILIVAAFFGGVRFERERRRIADDDLIRLIQETVAPSAGEFIDENCVDSGAQE
jgi:hypothetical protein